MHPASLASADVGVASRSRSHHITTRHAYSSQPNAAALVEQKQVRGTDIGLRIESIMNNRTSENGFLKG